jgi:very-short-patch-repair endonuclease
MKRPNVRKTTEKFIQECQKIHKKYDYSLVEYVTNKTPVKIICNIHGVFSQIPSHHLKGSGCPKCANDVKSIEFFIEKSKLIHGNYYDYSKVEFKNTNNKVIIVCPKHGDFSQQPKHHYNGAGCPYCKQSKGERDIIKYLKENNIKFISQKRFNDCRDKKPLPFDFYLPELNICIEFDGEQHFKSKSVFGGDKEFENRVRRDVIKTNYCDKTGIKLIRIKNNETINLK